MMEAARWTFITVSYNSAEELRRHWVAPLPSYVEWIVVDNASDDDSAATAESLGARVIRLDKNVGFGRANNVGFTHSDGTYVAFVNPDVTVDAATLAGLEHSLGSLGGLVAPQLVNPDGSPQPSGRAAPSLSNKILSRLNIARVRAKYYIIVEPGDERYVAWMTGAVVTGLRAELRQLGVTGPWDPRFFVYYEDSDIGLRAWQAGLTVRVNGSARWVHAWARETTRLRWRPWLLELDSMARFYSRYPAMIIGGGGRRFARERHQRWGQSIDTSGGTQ